MSRKLHILLGDLVHVSEANQQNYYVPLNVGYLAAYAKKRFGQDVAVEVFKEPLAMLDRANDGPVDVVGLASYYWNNRLNDAVAARLRVVHPDAVFVAGGPSIDADPDEMGGYRERHSWIDFVVPNEGEDAFAAVVEWAMGSGDGPKIGAGLSTDLAAVPSPWLDGTLDPYLDGPWQPLIQTSRLCPYTCLAGDTPINTIFGNIPIRELAERYGDAGVPVYTFDPKTRNAFIADSVMVRRYGQDRQLVRVHFDDETHIDCTPDHRFLQIARGRQWECEASDLPAGASVRALRVEVNQHMRRAYVTWARRDKRLRSRMVKEVRSAGGQGKIRSLESRLRYRESKLGTKNTNFRYEATERATTLRGRRSRIAEVNHKVVSVEWLVEKGDVYCLTVPVTGWFFANNVLVKNCSFCVSGKNRGKLRAFPLEQVQAEVEFVGKRFSGRRDYICYIVDENFGILHRDVDVARMLARSQRDYGYPRRLFYYNDKRFTQTSRDVHEVVGDMCHHGVTLSLQSENPETLKAIRRRNLTDDQVADAIAWAKALGLRTSTELIFGLPMETRESFLALLDKCARVGFDAIQCYNLIIFDGIEMNRKSYRENHDLRTVRRPMDGCVTTFDDGEIIAESEEVVVASSSFSTEDYKLVRKLNVLFHAIFVRKMMPEMFSAIIRSGRSLTGELVNFLQNPTCEDHAVFLDDLDAAISCEIEGGSNGLIKIQPVFAGRLVDAPWAAHAFGAIA